MGSAWCSLIKSAEEKDGGHAVACNCWGMNVCVCLCVWVCVCVCACLLEVWSRRPCSSCCLCSYLGVEGRDLRETLYMLNSRGRDGTCYTCSALANNRASITPALCLCARLAPVCFSPVRFTGTDAACACALQPHAHTGTAILHAPVRFAHMHTAQCLPRDGYGQRRHVPDVLTQNPTKSSPSVSRPP